MKKLQYALMALAALPMAALAQTQVNDTALTRTVVVEQEYTPHIMDATKVSALPQVEPLTVTKKDIEYAETPAPARQIPAEAMQPFAGQEKQAKATPGYVRLGYGNYGNLDARADYRFTLSPRDQLQATFAMDAMDGTLDLPDGSGEWDSYYYHTTAALGYKHSFDRADLNVGGNFGLSNFNFLPQTALGKQKFTSGGVHIGAASTSADIPLQFAVETNVLFYQRQNDLAGADAGETMARTKADVWSMLDGQQSIGVALGMDNVFYKNNQFDNYTSLTLTPHYDLRNEHWAFRAGVNVDLAFGFGKTFRISPDVEAQYTFADRYSIYAQAKGGKRQNDFRRMESFTPYGLLPWQLDATYEQVNAALGVRIGTLNGIRVNLYGGYQNLKNDLFTLYLPAAPGFSLLDTWNTDNLYAGAEVSYEYKDIVALTAHTVYRKWSADGEGDDIGVLYFKPEVEANIKLEVRPVSPLRVHVGFLKTTRTETAGLRMDPVDNLYAGADYNLFKGIAVYARLDNLLNKHYQYYPYIPAEGFNLVGGVSFRF